MSLTTASVLLRTGSMTNPAVCDPSTDIVPDSRSSCTEGSIAEVGARPTDEKRILRVSAERSLFRRASVMTQQSSKAKAYNTCRAPQVTYRDFRGTGHVTGQASVERRR